MDDPLALQAAYCDHRVDVTSRASASTQGQSVVVGEGWANRSAWPANPNERAATATPAFSTFRCG